MSDLLAYIRIIPSTLLLGSYGFLVFLDNLEQEKDLFDQNILESMILLSFTKPWDTAHSLGQISPKLITLLTSYLQSQRDVPRCCPVLSPLPLEFPTVDTTTMVT